MFNHYFLEYFFFSSPLLVCYMYASVHSVFVFLCSVFFMFLPPWAAYNPNQSENLLLSTACEFPFHSLYLATQECLSPFPLPTIPCIAILYLTGLLYLCLIPPYFHSEDVPSSFTSKGFAKFSTGPSYTQFPQLLPSQCIFCCCFCC